MQFDDFIKLYTGIPCDFDNYAGTQCMDLSHFYAYICLNIHDKTVLAADVAKNVWFKYNPAWDKYFTKVENTPTGIPLKGDIIIWNGTAGHIAVVVDATMSHFRSFDANYPVGSFPKIVYHDYTNVLGWLHPKMQNNSLQAKLDKIKEVIDS